MPTVPLKTTTIAPLLSLVAPRGNRRGSLWRSWQLGLFEHIFLRHAWWNEKNGEQFRITPGEMKWTEWILQSWIIRDLFDYQQWPQVDTGWLLILKMLANHGQPVLGWKRPEEADFTGLWWKKCSVFVFVLDFIGFGHIMMLHTLMDPTAPKDQSMMLFGNVWNHQPVGKHSSERSSLDTTQNDFWLAILAVPSYNEMLRRHPQYRTPILQEMVQPQERSTPSKPKRRVDEADEHVTWTSEG